MGNSGLLGQHGLLGQQARRHRPPGPNALSLRPDRPSSQPGHERGDDPVARLVLRRPGTRRDHFAGSVGDRDRSEACSFGL